jgi:hypothetical protein
MYPSPPVIKYVFGHKFDVISTRLDNGVTPFLLIGNVIIPIDLLSMLHHLRIKIPMQFDAPPQ